MIHKDLMLDLVKLEMLPWHSYKRQKVPEWETSSLNCWVLQKDFLLFLIIFCVKLQHLKIVKKDQSSVKEYLNIPYFPCDDPNTDDTLNAFVSFSFSRNSFCNKVSRSLLLRKIQRANPVCVCAQELRIFSYSSRVPDSTPLFRMHINYLVQYVGVCVEPESLFHS